MGFPPGVGDKLAGKVWQSVLTLGGNDVQYTAEGGLGCTVDELLLPFEKTAVYCSMQWRAPFNVYGVIVEEMPGYKMITDEDLAARCQAFRQLLQDYQ